MPGGPASEIFQCYATGAIDITVFGSASYVGGLVGACYGGEYIYACYANVDITITSSNNDDIEYVGGLIGHLPGGLTYNCYSQGDINLDGSIRYVGGFTGYADLIRFDLIDRCYSVGAITTSAGATSVGGFIGKYYDDGGNLTDCCWYTSASSNAIGYVDSEGGAVATLAENNYGTDESDNTALYDKTHTIYYQGGSYEWDFVTPIWYEWSDRYPLFTEEPPFWSLTSCSNTLSYSTSTCDNSPAYSTSTCAALSYSTATCATPTYSTSTCTTPSWST